MDPVTRVSRVLAATPFLQSLLPVWPLGGLRGRCDPLALHNVRHGARALASQARGIPDAVQRRRRTRRQGLFAHLPESAPPALRVAMGTAMKQNKKKVSMTGTVRTRPEIRSVGIRPQKGARTSVLDAVPFFRLSFWRRSRLSTSQRDPADYGGTLKFGSAAELGASKNGRSSASELWAFSFGPDSG